MQTRLLLVSHAATRAMRVGAFPADDPLDARGLAEIEAWRERAQIVAQAARVFRSDATCVREMAEALGLKTEAAPALADVDCGEWRGRRLSDLAAEEPDALAAWTRSPDAAPPGGESFGMVLARVGAWLDALQPAHDGDALVAITHAVVIRAAIIYALGAPASAFRRIEIAPLSIVELRRSRDRSWVWWPGHA
ncbi:histidine phosphatase family protein [Paraburkholderia sp. GAS334]|uniref:histidine phosphatase family protein n=1 Tax=Paraburkholderia sp. GAS334 TaxID=3035131 RepID=UPI003D215D7A